jgi:hypothetical protein
MIDWRQDADRVLFWKSRIRHFAASRCARWAPLTASFTAAALHRVGPELAAAASAQPAHLYIAHNLGALPAAAAAAARHGARLGFDAEDFHRGQYDASDPAARAIRSVEERCLPACDGGGVAGVTGTRPYAGGHHGRAERLPLASRRAPARYAGSPLRLYWFSRPAAIADGRHRGGDGSLPNLSIELPARSGSQGRRGVGELADVWPAVARVKAAVAAPTRWCSWRRNARASRSGQSFAEQRSRAVEQ